VAREMEAVRPPDHDLLILGSTIRIESLIEPSFHRHFPGTFGWLGEECDEAGSDGRDVAWSDAVWGRWREEGGKVGFCSSWYSFRDRISGGYDGNCHGGFITDAFQLIKLYDKAKELWDHAGNLTQWKGKQSVTS
jgi:hypothetical protein